jgi:hypothetical protein
MLEAGMRVGAVLTAVTTMVILATTFNKDA